MANDGFPGAWPDFTADQRKQLKRLGVTDEQVRQLRHALYVIQVHVSPRVRSAATRERLEEVGKCAKNLSKKLQPVTLGERQALTLLDREYWRADAALIQQQIDAGLLPEPRTGPTVQHRVLRELDFLIAAAKVALAELPKGRRGRGNTASPRPIEAIDDALRMGFLKPDGHTFIARTGYPKALEPNAKERGTFRKIVGICYQAVGGTDDPLRAIRTFLAEQNAKRNDLLAAFDEALRPEPCATAEIERSGKRKLK